METINSKFRRVIALNEGGPSVAYRFSDPDGKPGRSGWSFAVCQFDTRNNPMALKCLHDCGFTKDEINGIVNQTIDVAPFSDRLLAHASIIDKYDEAQLRGCLNAAGNFVSSHSLAVADDGAVLALADYVNQYGSLGDGAAAFFKSLPGPIKPEDVLTFKLDHTKYGKEHPGDCKRRYANLMSVLA